MSGRRPPRSAGLVAVDLDGTLLRTDGSVSPRVRTSVQRARDAGFVVACATGRPWPQARDVVAAAGGMDYGVCLNGAVVLDAGTGDILIERAMSRDDAIAAARVVRDVIADASLGVDLADGRHYWEYAFDPDIPTDLGVVRTSDAVAEVDGAVLTWLVGTDRHHADEVIDRIAPHLPSAVEVRSSGLDTAEIAVHGVNKASGLELVAERYGWTAAETVVFGDGANDVEMLSWAGHAVVMANAPEAIRALGSEVAPSNDDDGVAVILERLAGAVGG